MNRRTFVAGPLGLAAATAFRGRSRLAAAQDAATRSTDLPDLEIVLTDTGFEFPQPLQAGRYAVTVTNTGASTESHFGLGKIPDRVSEAEYEEWLAGYGVETEALRFEDIAFVGVPDWPPPGGSTSGVIDLAPGRYFLFDPFDARGYLTLAVDGEVAASEEPAADLTVTLNEMEIVLPESAFTTERVRWKIENSGAMCHEVAVLAVSPDFTEEHLHLLFTLPEDATPPPDVPAFVYQPVAAIGILAGGQTSWLDLQLAPGRYLAICMLPFSTGYPHAMDGMYRFFEVA